MSSLRELQLQQTRERLYEAALALFRERDFEDVSVDEITAKAGTAKGTFFNHFPTKDHVLAEFHSELVGWILSQVEDRDFDTCEEAITACVLTFPGWPLGDRKIAESMVRRVFTSPIMSGSDARNSQRFMEWFAHHVDRGIATGELKVGLERNTMLAMIAAVLSSTLNSWALGAQFDLREELGRRIRFVFDAARA